MTTVYTGQELVVKLRKRPTTTKARARPIKREFSGKPVKFLQIPSVSADYNDNMGGVDIGDQLRASEGLQHRVYKGNWRALAWKFLLETCLVNSYLLQLRGQPNWQPYTDQRAWRQQVCDSFFAAYASDGSSRELFKTGDENKPVLQHNHVNRKKRGRCLACQGFQLGQTRLKERALQPVSRNVRQLRKAPQSRWGCDSCDVALCTGQKCWDFWYKLN